MSLWRDCLHSKQQWPSDAECSTLVSIAGALAPVKSAPAPAKGGPAPAKGGPAPSKGAPAPAPKQQAYTPAPTPSRGNPLQKCQDLFIGRLQSYIKTASQCTLVCYKHAMSCQVVLFACELKRLVLP